MYEIPRPAPRLASGPDWMSYLVQRLKASSGEFVSRAPIWYARFDLVIRASVCAYPAVIVQPRTGVALSSSSKPRDRSAPIWVEQVPLAGISLPLASRGASAGAVMLFAA